MNWIQSLYETYENCQNQLGYSGESQRPLLPICHITTQTQIEIVIDGEGNFRDARLVDKADATTIIPATEVSASRSGSKPVCHPFCDKLQYLAGDFSDYGGQVTSGFASDPAEPYNKYVAELLDWCNSRHGHPKACAVLAYIKKKNLMRDLINFKILIVGGDGKLVDKQQIDRDKSTKDIFSILNVQDNALVRWVVQIPGDVESRTWCDATLWNSWISHYLDGKEAGDVCLVSGKNRFLTNNHPKYIRREGDNAKLISANDTSGFTYRGRFLTDDQASGVGLEVSQKAHYALLWLISRQGYVGGDLAVVAWATSGAKLPQPTNDPIDALDEDAPIEDSKNADTAQVAALRLKKKIAGYRQKIDDRADVAVMAVDSATPGRLSIVYYRTLMGSDFLERIEGWHETCAWRHTYRFVERDENGGTRKRRTPFIGAPAPADIAEAAYGARLDDQLKKATIKRLLPCIVDGQPVPYDIVASLVRRASNRVGLEDWEWNKVLSIACSLFRKYKSGKEKYEMTLDETRNTRDYLYGRLLALADNLESWALRDANEQRETSAARLMQRFAEHPFSTWRQIELALRPYIARLGGKSTRLQREIDKVVDMFNPQEFIRDTRLSGEFLLGYHSQREALWRKRSSESDHAESGTAS